ncbi:MAG TPA: glycosyltransferase [Azospirillum sp.]|nr:glycosyltransferase [Azospirillum sp.]
MAETVLFLALFSLASWVYLCGLRGGFWRADQRLAPDGGQTTGAHVVAIVPARNEEAYVGRALRALLAQKGVELHVVLVDDHSHDRTRAVAEALAAEAGGRLTVTGTAPLPGGWTGKLWALEEGVRVAGRVDAHAEYLLLTDADVEIGPSTLRRLLAKAGRERLDLASLMVELDHRGVWGRLLIPAFVFFFQKLYPFRWVADLSKATAAAAGGCILVRRAALERAGGVGAIRGALIDDCALAAAVKRSGGRIWLGLADDARSLRDNRRLSSIWDVVARTAYTQLNHAPTLLAGTLAGMMVTYLVPPLATLLWPLHGSAAAAAVGGAAWLLMMLCYRPTLRCYGQPTAAGTLLPLAGLLYSLMTASSAVRHWRGRGGHWKGRVYPTPVRSDSGEVRVE